MRKRYWISLIVGALVIASMVVFALPAKPSVSGGGILGIGVGRAYASPNTETLRPNAAGDEENIATVYGDGVGTHYTTVDETVSDDDTSYVESADSTTWKRDLYNIANHSIGSGTINFIKIYANARITGSAGLGCLQVSLKTGDSAYNSGSFTVEMTSYTLFSNQWTNNPKTSVAWTWDDIDALQIGINIRRAASGSLCRVTQVYVEVDYTAGEEPDITVTPSGYNFGVVNTNSTPNTGNAAFTITNSSTMTIDISIKCNGWSPVSGIGTWTYGSPIGEDKAFLKASSANGGAGGSQGQGLYDIEILNGEDTLLCDDVGIGTNPTFELQLNTSSSHTHGDEQQTIVTLTAVANPGGGQGLGFVIVGVSGGAKSAGDEDRQEAVGSGASVQVTVGFTE